MMGRCGQGEVRANEQRIGNDEPLPGALSHSCQLTGAGPVSDCRLWTKVVANTFFLHAVQ